MTSASDRFPGPATRNQLSRIRRVWKQGEHWLISGATGSGKTKLARYLGDIRYDNGGYVIVLCMKPLEDKTIVEDYLGNGYVRWKKWKARPGPHEKRVVLWPDVSKAKGNRSLILAMQKEVFAAAFEGLNKVGNWTVIVDEGLYTVAPEFLNMGPDLAMGHAIGRSGLLTWITLTQRPSHLPLLIYGSASHAAVGRTRELADQKRLAELGAKEGSKELGRQISGLGRHDFLWVPVAPDWPAEKINLAN